MSKRYVFWRNAEGKPHRDTNCQTAPTALLAALGKEAVVRPDGKIQSEGFWRLKFDPAIKAAFVVIGPEGREMNATDSWLILNKAIRSTIVRQGGRRPLDPMEVLKEANREAGEHFRSLPAEYVLLTSLSLKSFPATTIRIRGCEVTALQKRTSRYPYPQALEARATGQLRSTRYRPIRVKTVGYTAYDAADRALEAVNLLRGFWNFFATFGDFSHRSGFHRHKPISAIHIGPFHTLHSTDGTLIGDVYWYEPGFMEEHQLFEPKHGWAGIEGNRRKAVARMQHLAFRRDLEDLFIRYGSALDQVNPDLTFLHLWGILEKLTDTVGRRYDETIQRASWIFKDRGFAEEVLNAIRRSRNQFVHGARSSDDRDRMAYLVKYFVDPHLLHLLGNDFQIKDLKEYGECLALPRDEATLVAQRRQLGQALRRLKKWNATNE